MAGLADSVTRVRERVATIARLNAELAQLEVKRKAAKLGIGAGLGAAAAVLLLFAVWFLFAAIAAAIATQIPLWAALLIVAGAILLIAGSLVAVTVRLLRKGGAPVPEKAVTEGKRTLERLRGNGRAQP